MTDVLGGRYVAPTATLSFEAAARGPGLEFRAAPSARTHVLDLAIVTAEAVFGVATAGYADCILDAVARSGPAPLRDAPGLVLSCLPGLAQANAALRFYLDHLEPVSNVLRAGLVVFDQARDRLSGETGLLLVTRPSPLVGCDAVPCDGERNPQREHLRTELCRWHVPAL